jgi:hypothetical protein
MASSEYINVSVNNKTTKMPKPNQENKKRQKRIMPWIQGLSHILKGSSFREIRGIHGVFLM